VFVNGHGGHLRIRSALYIYSIQKLEMFYTGKKFNALFAGLISRTFFSQ